MNARGRLAFLGWPAFVWLAAFVVIPLMIVLILSFLSRGTYGGIEWNFQFGNYARVFETVYLGIFFSSVKLALSTAAICLLLAYPMAWAMSTSSAETRRTLIVLMAIPFLTNLITRVYAVKLFTGMDGPLQAILNGLGIGFDPYQMSQNQVLVLYGMITTYLPFMVFPLFAAMEKFDFSLVEAAQDLGCGPWETFFKVIVPNTKVAALSGVTLVFIPCLGEFVIPDLLGGAKTMLAGNLITEQFLKSRDWPFGAALSMVLILILLVVPRILRAVVSRTQRAVNERRENEAGGRT